MTMQALDPRRNAALLGAAHRGALHLHTSDDGSLLGIDELGCARLADPTTTSGARALAKLAFAQPFHMVRGPAEATDAFVTALPDASRWSRPFESFEMIHAEANAAPPRTGSMHAATERTDSFDAWRLAFTREAFPAGGTPPPVARDQLFVWVVDSVPRAMAGLLPMADGARIVTVYTPPEARRQGHASALVGALATAARRTHAQVTLDVSVTDPSARHAYERAGFRVVSRTATWLREASLTER